MDAIESPASNVAQDLEAQKAALLGQTLGFLRHSWRKHLIHFWLNATFVVTGILLGTAVTLTGVVKGTEWLAPFIGAAISVLFGIQSVFKFAEKSNLWIAKHSDAKDLRDHLNYKVHNRTEFESFVDRWLSLRKELMADMPAASAVEPGKQSG